MEPRRGLQTNRHAGPDPGQRGPGAYPLRCSIASSGSDTSSRASSVAIRRPVRGHLVLDRVAVDLEAELLAHLVEVDHEPILGLDLPERRLLDHGDVGMLSKRVCDRVALGALGHAMPT